nr:leucine-rich repeat protein [uncultured Ruminococcus sp.]
MKSIKKPLSLLLSLVMIFSVFTIIPMSASAEDAPTVTLSKWVESTQEDPDEFSFEGLYDNFIFCRVNPDKNPKTEANPWAQNVVYDKTNDLSMTGDDTNFAKNDNNYYQLDHYYGDNSHIIWGSWEYSQYYDNSDLIYLKDNDVHFSDGCKFWAYTWKDVTLTEHAQVPPTYEDGVYKNGTDKAYYTCEEEGVYFVSDGNGSYVQISEANLFNEPYFEFDSYNNGSEIGVSKYNGADTVVTIPDKIPDNYYDTRYRGLPVHYVHSSTFKDNTSVTKVVMGDMTRHLGYRAFMGCTALEEVEIGSGLRKIDSEAFYNCSALRKFTCTATGDTIEVTKYPFDNNISNVTFYGHHTGSFRNAVNGFNISLNGTKTYIGIDAHTCSAVFNWDGCACSSANVTCSACDFSGTVDATVSSEVTTPATAYTEGVRTYTATAVYGDQTFTDTKDEAIPALGVKYLDENGEEQTANGAVQITADTAVLSAGWYSVDGSVTVNGSIDVTGDAKIILTDGAALTVTGELGLYAASYNYPISVYRQSGNTQGKLNAASITANDLTLVGGELTVDNFIRSYGSVTVYGGELNIPNTEDGRGSVYCENDITVNGGNIDITNNSNYCFSTVDGTVTINGGDVVLRGAGSGLLAGHVIITGGKLNSVGIRSKNEISLGWKDVDNDYIFSSAYYPGGDIVIEKPFQDQNSAVYMPAVYDADTLAAKGLTPAVPHEHELSHVAAVPITCTEGGNIEYWYCEECNKYFSDQDGYAEIPEDEAIIPAYSHDWQYGDGVWTWGDNYNSPTIRYTYSCSRCGETVTLNSYNMKVLRTKQKDSTCDSAGFITYVASVSLDKTYSDEHTYTLPKLDHTIDHYPAAAPAYNAENKTYTNGNIEYWHCSVCGKYFDDAAFEHEINLADTVVPYFEFYGYADGADTEWGVSKYNGADTAVVIPDKIPDTYPDETIRGMNVEYVHNTAFRGNTDITKVVMGDTMEHLGWQAFKGCTALKEVEIGTGLRTIDSEVFFDCTALEKFTCTKTDDVITAIGRPFNNDDQTPVTFYGYHSGSFRDVVNTDNWSTGAKRYIGVDAHTYRPHFNWDGYECSSATVTCDACDYSVDVAATTSHAVTTPVTPYTDGVRTHTATAVYDGHTFTDVKTETIPALGVKYLDENDEEQTAYSVTQITADTTALTGGWYSVDGSVTVNGSIDVTGDSKIILTDGSKLTVNGELGKYVVQNHYPLTFYRQSGETEGKLNVTSITANNFKLVGGDITSESFVRDYGDLDICGGKLKVPASDTQNAVDCSGDITVSGGYLDITGDTCLMTLSGTVTVIGGDLLLRGKGSGIFAENVFISGGAVDASASDTENNGKGVKSYNEIKLSWTDPDHDFVLSNGYDQNVTLEKTFVDQGGTIYQPGTYDSAAFASKKLTPIFAHEHTLAHVPAAAPTCDEEGCIEHWYCEQCEKYFSDQDGYYEIPQTTAVIPPNGHTFDHTAAVIPTHDAQTGVYTPGNIEYWHCSVCGKYYSDADGNTEVALEDIVLPYFKLTKLDNGTARIVKYNAHDADVIIPDTVPESLATDDLPAGTAITQVGAYSFKNNTYIKNITMGDNIDTIDYQSFQNCSNLETVTVGSGLNDLRYESFKDCPNLRSFTCTSKNKFFYNENLGEPFGGSKQAVAYVYHGSSLMNKLSIKTIGIDRHSEPAWTWAADCSSATADINCNISSCKYHSGELPATVTSEITSPPTGDADGVQTYTATVVVDGETYTSTREEAIPSYFPRHSLTLGGDIGVNFYVRADAADVASGKAKVSFAWNNKTETVTLGGDPYEIDGMQLYKATAYVSAAEMTDVITATLYIDDVETAVHHYSVRAYCDVIFSDDYRQAYSDERFEYDELAILVKTMLNYGATAQKQFDHNTDNLANQGIDYPLSDLDQSEIEALGDALPKSGSFNEALSPYGVKYYGCSLLLRSKTTLRFYFEKTGTGEYSADNFKINGAPAEVKNYQDGSRYVYIEITDIPSPDLDKAYDISVGNVTIGSVSPLSYVKDVLTDDSASADLINVITALYRYHEAAKILFG